MLRSTHRPLLPAFALLTLTLAACGQTSPTALVSDPVLTSTQASVTLRLPAPQGLSAQYINQNKTTRLDVQIDSGTTTSYTLGSAQAPCANGFCTVTLLNLAPGSHAFTFGTYGVNPATSTTVLISQGSLTATLLGGQANTFPLTLTPVSTGLALSSAVKQYNPTSRTFGNYVKFTTLKGRSLPAFYDIQTIDSVGDPIPQAAKVNAVVCGDTGTALTDISDGAHLNRFRVEVQTTGTHTLSVQAGTSCAAGATPLTTQAVSGVAPLTGAGASRATIAAGEYHSVALLQDGTVRTWGYNNFAQLGDGTTTSSNVPVTVTGLSTAVGVAAGDLFTLALLSDGTVRTWGFGGLGQLGNGTYQFSSTVPVTVTGLSNVVGLSAGNGHGVALLADGTVQTWGSNSDGQLGTGGTNYFGSNVPVRVNGLDTAAAVVAGDNSTMALLSDGTVRAWGNNDAGQLGTGTTADSLVPAPVPGVSTATSIAMGEKHSLAGLADGTALAWGNNDNGQLGTGTTTSSTTPVSVINLNGVVSVAAGSQHSLALMNDGTARAWGLGSDGQLGTGRSQFQSTVPVAVAGLSTITRLVAGQYHSLALLSDGTMRAWGFGVFGQLGNNTGSGSTTPVAVTGLSTVAQPTP